jgi:hypothetical protein
VGFVVEKVALGQVFSECFGFPCQSSFHQFLHHHNHPGLAQKANRWPQCRVDPVGLHPPLFELKNNSGLAIYGMNCVLSLERWDRGFESHQVMDAYVRLFCVCVVLFVGSGLATG